MPNTHPISSHIWHQGIESSYYCTKNHLSTRREKELGFSFSLNFSRVFNEIRTLCNNSNNQAFMWHCFLRIPLSNNIILNVCVCMQNLYFTNLRYHATYILMYLFEMVKEHLFDIFFIFGENGEGQRVQFKNKSIFVWFLYDFDLYKINYLLSLWKMY